MIEYKEFLFMKKNKNKIRNTSIFWPAGTNPDKEKTQKGIMLPRGLCV